MPFQNFTNKLSLKSKLVIGFGTLIVFIALGGAVIFVELSGALETDLPALRGADVSKFDTSKFDASEFERIVYNVEESISRAESIGITVTGLLVVLGVLLSLLVGYTIIGPVKESERVARDIARGDLSRRIKVAGEDEFGGFAAAFNSMADRLEKLYRELEARVALRTEELRHEKDKLGTVLESIGDGVFVVDRDLHIILFNRAAAHLSGLEEREALGKFYGDALRFVREGSGEANDSFIKDAARTGRIRDMENHTELLRKNGSRLAVAASAAPLRDRHGSVAGCVVVLRNVTREREIDRAKTEFVSIASHQLRTPLSTIGWYAEMLLAGDAGELSGEQKSFVRELYAGNRRMVELVDALLNVSRIDLGTFAVEPGQVDFRKIAESVLSDLEKSISEKKLSFKKHYGEDVPEISFDPRLARIIFQNLLSNAVKYTPEGGEVGLSVSRSGDELAVEVSDTGYGIPKDEWHKVGTKLFRADNVRQKETKGTGLGLYIVRAVVTEAGGRLRFESEEDKGTTFYVTLPLSGMKKREGAHALV